MTLTEILEKMQGAHVAVVGDAMNDRYIFGRVERICPEAPVPIFIPNNGSIDERPGGAANVSQQLYALGCKVHQGFAPYQSIKTRYMVGSHLVMRVDDDVTAHPTPDDIENIAGYLAGIKSLDAVILSDYNKGWLSPGMCHAIIEVAVSRYVPVVVDPKGQDWQKFSGCSLICPSTSDGFTSGASRGFDILHKQGADGMSLHVHTSDYGRVPGFSQHIPTTARHVYDVTGAGDTVVAVVAAAIAVGASKLEAATLAALAAGYVVGEVGTTVCSKEKLKELIDARD